MRIEHPQNATPIQLCKAIAKLVAASPDKDQTDIYRAYSVTWSIVYLHKIGLAVPTKGAQMRLLDLYMAVAR